DDRKRNRTEQQRCDGRKDHPPRHAREQSARLTAPRGQADAFRRDVEEPAECECDGETGEASDHQDTEHTGLELERLENQVRRLEHHEDRRRVADPDTDDSPALQLAEEIHRVMRRVHGSRIKRQLSMSYDTVSQTTVVTSE